MGKKCVIVENAVMAFKVVIKPISSTRHPFLGLHYCSLVFRMLIGFFGQGRAWLTV
ncbi:hypothetical protein IYQ_06586 [Aeromonas salmonicida subsp. salmonicida 01-B526]|uniref:Uncharacterized protein n=1 Tax=Aeromonas salmonicida subsp. salmonicida 01-B526 TaxID=1076135 RepID=A0ABN0E2K1_AERSS|nr:hypothetical protein IYQ_06586 [Aeromonas salmonicida subsp. salmonicida 01-B526]